MQKRLEKNIKGFTLIELAVVMAVFMLIVGVSIAIFLSIIKSQKRILAQEQLLSQASYAMEYMSKGLRMARRDDDNLNCISPNYNYLYTKPDEENIYQGIKFINQSNDNACQEFYLDADLETGNKIIKDKKIQYPAYEQESDIPLTSEKFNIDYLKFSIDATGGLVSDGDGSSILDGRQPRVTVIFGFKVPGDEDQPEIKIQTTISQRNLNATE